MSTARKVRGAKLDLASFHGDSRDSLPSGSGSAEPAQRSERPVFRDRIERPESEVKPPSRADEASAWRRNDEGPRRDDSSAAPRWGNRDRDQPRRFERERDFDRPAREERPAHLRFGNSRRQDDERAQRRPAAIDDGDNEDGEGESQREAEPKRQEDAPRWRRPARDSEADSTAPRAVGDSDAEWRSYSRSQRDGDQGRSGGRGFGRFDRGDRESERDRPSRFDRGGASGTPEVDPAREARFARFQAQERRGGGGDSEDRGGRFARPADSERSSRFDREDRGGRFDREDRGGFRERRGGDRDRDTRPAHLRFGRDGDERPSRYERPSEFDPLPSAPAHKLAAKREAQLQSTKGKEETAKEEKVAQPIERKEGAYADNLHVPVVPVSQKQTALERAIQERESIDEKELVDSLSRIDLSGGDVRTSAGDVLARSIIEGKVKLAQILENAKSSQAEHAASLALETILAYKNKKSDRELLALVKGSNADVLSIIAPNKSGADLTDFLSQHSILILAPVPDLSKDVEAKLKANASADDILKLITSQVDAKVSVNSLNSLISTHVYGKVLAEAGKANMDILQSFRPLLKRVLDDDQSQMESLFTLMNVWFKAGAAKGVLKEVFNGLLETEIIDVEPFFLWKEDTTVKGAAKTKALLQLNAWLDALLPRRKVETYDDEEDEDGEEYDEEEEEEDEDDY